MAFRSRTGVFGDWYRHDANLTGALYFLSGGVGDQGIGTGTGDASGGGVGSNESRDERIKSKPYLVRCFVIYRAIENGKIQGDPP